jgi:hypothetical protein
LTVREREIRKFNSHLVGAQEVALNQQVICFSVEIRLMDRHGTGIFPVMGVGGVLIQMIMKLYLMSRFLSMDLLYISTGWHVAGTEGELQLRPLLPPCER